ncbi:ABC transporter substrate-binding protein [Limibaculum sp. M0105]|uniref:ABC transporter substrate-binding protein n=1 Tax=Thermohalobaculum xanthum TaxID=2753746 RepID=A0A8J7M4R9_9RHOB|nr:ABC transporter substrate-binding protein [Thermohalobaculum xanthum]MBK0398268.1 ABC transporter substrate-binding protein [Thermohalobaculum xanthum]
MTNKNGTSKTGGILRPDRRSFLGGTAALGLAAGLGPALLPRDLRAAEPKKGGKLRVAMQQGATTDSLDPQTYTDTFMLSIGFGTHGTLTEINPEGELVGDLAESWEASTDAKTWTFRIRKGVEFSDGKTLTADDVIASINHHRGEDSKSAAKSNVDPIAEIRKPDDNTVVFDLKNGNADFPYLMADYHLLIMPAVDGKADWENYIGTGGYVLDTFEPGIRATLKRNPNYWKPGRAHIDEIEMVVIADPAARQNALITGEVDYLQRADLKTVHLLARRPEIHIEESTGFLHYTAPMITTNSPYDSNELRLAIKHGINRDELLEKILRGHGAIGNDHPIAPSVPFWADLEQRTYDPDKAKFHLKKSGYEGVTLDLSAADAAYAGAVDAAVLMKEQLAAAGMDINVVREPNDGYWSNVWMKKDWCQCYWGGRPTCDWMFSQAYAEGANWNDTYWSNERFNVLLKQGRAELNPSVRAEIYREMQQIVRDDGGVVVWAFANYVDARTDKVQHGEKVAANWDMDGGRFMERWWVA